MQDELDINETPTAESVETVTESQEPTDVSAQPAPETKSQGKSKMSDEEKEAQKAKKRYVKMTMQSGLPPMEMRYTPINACGTGYPVAYMTTVIINSVLMGTITEGEYATAANNSELGIHLAEWQIGKAIDALVDFKNADRSNLQYIVVPCPIKMALQYNLHTLVGDILQKKHCEHPEKLCIAFTGDILNEDPGDVKTALLDLKVLKIKSMITGVGSVSCPLPKLAQFPVNMVMITPESVSLSGNRDRPEMFTALLAYVHAMGIDILADGVMDDNQRYALNRAECLGYIASDIYLGNAHHGKRNMTLEEALEQQEEDQL